ncbi:MAG TPA: hypothetical protein VGE93_20125, partial [Bryobacteraceae bacterium]
PAAIGVEEVGLSDHTATSSPVVVACNTTEVALSPQSVAAALATVPAAALIVTVAVSPSLAVLGSVDKAVLLTNV